MEDAHRPLSYSPYAQPIPDNLVTQQSIYYPARPWSQQQSTQEPLLPMPRPINDQSNEQPSMICGFTLSELAQVAIQVAGVTIAAVFGAWAIKAYESANIANQLSEDSLSQSNIANQLAQDALKQSSYANILAIINLCLSDQVRLEVVIPTILALTCILYSTVTLPFAQLSLKNPVFRALSRLLYRLCQLYRPPHREFRYLLRQRCLHFQQPL